MRRRGREGIRVHLREHRARREDAECLPGGKHREAKVAKDLKEKKKHGSKDPPLQKRRVPGFAAKSVARTHAAGLPGVTGRTYTSCGSAMLRQLFLEVTAKKAAAS